MPFAGDGNALTPAQVIAVRPRLATRELILNHSSVSAARITLIGVDGASLASASSGFA
jgi:hypothetical protein